MNLLPRSKRGVLGFDMTPMIDVVFQLLIFFLFTSRFTETVRTPLALPSERGDGALDQPADLIVDVTAQGILIMDGQEIDLAGFEKRLDAELLKYGDASLLEVLVRADREARSGAVNAVVNALAAKNVRLWRLGTAVPGSASGGSN